MTDLTDEAVKALPDEIQVWRSTDTLDHIGTWATTRFPPEAVTYVSKADAQAAVALVVQQAAERLEINRAHLNFEALLGLLRDKTLPEPVVTALSDWLDVIAAAIRALAPADGLAAVDALRAEIADLKMNMDADLRTMVREGQQLRTLATELAAAQQREAGLVAAMEIIAKQKRTDELDTEHDVEMADFEGGYDAAINVARAALATQEAKNG